jgi:plasmid stabilization system protein ParE
MTLRIRSHAELEYYEAIAYYLGEHSPQSADRFEQEVDRALEAILQNPQLFNLVDLNVLAKSLKKFPYSVLYSVENNEIVVLAIAHQSRKPGYWRDRL